MFHNPMLRFVFFVESINLNLFFWYLNTIFAKKIFKDMPNLVRLILGFVVLGASIAIMFTSFWGWGILGVFISILVFVTFFYNEKMLLAQWFLRKDNMGKAEVFLRKITNYEKELFRGQHGYYNLLIGLI